MVGHILKRRTPAAFPRQLIDQKVLFRYYFVILSLAKKNKTRQRRWNGEREAEDYGILKDYFPILCVTFKKPRDFYRRRSEHK